MAPLVLGPGGGFAFGGGGGDGPVPPSRPAAFTVGMWGLADAETGGTLTVSIDSLPDDRGSEITDIEYSIDGGGWERSGGVAGFDIPGLTDDREYAVRLRAINANGAGPASDTKRAAPTAEVVPAPSWSSPPTVSGTARVGETLTATGGTIADGTADGWAWLRDDAPIPGATSATYELTIDDVDAMVGPRELASGPGGSAYADASPVGPVEDVAPADRLVVNYNADEERYEITNAAAFPGATRAWLDEDGTPIAGQTGTTLALADAPAGLGVRAMANGDPDTLSVLCIAQPPLTVDLDETFDAPDGTPLHGYNGWECRRPSGELTPEQGALMKIRPGGVFMEGNTGARLFFHPLDTTGPKRVTIEGWRNADGPNAQVRNWREVYQYYDPATRNNHIRLGLTDYNTRLHKTVAGTGTSFPIQTGLVDDSTPSVGMANANGRGRTYVAGSETAASVSAGGWDVSDVPEFAGIALNLYGDFYPAEGGSFRVISRLLIENLQAKSFSLENTTEIEPDETYPMGAVLLEGICTDTVATFDWSVVNSKGVRGVEGAVNVAVDSAGEWSITIPITPELLAIGGPHLAIRDHTDKENLSILKMEPVSVVPAYTIGVNAGFSATWSGDYRERNIVHRGALRYPDGDSGGAGPGYLPSAPGTGLNGDGQIFSYPSDASANELQILIPDSCLPGVYSFSYPAGMTVTTSGLNKVTVTQPFSAGYGEITVTDNKPGGSLVVSGPIPPEGVGDQNLIFTEKSEHNLTTYFSTRFTDYMTACGWKIWRNMTPDGVNLGLQVQNGPGAMERVTSVVNNGGQSNGPLSPAAWAEISYMNGGTDLWINIRHDATPAYVEGFAAALAPIVNPNVKIYVEVTNELWNFFSGFGQHFWFRYEGVKRGYHAAGSATTPIPDLLDYYRKVANDQLLEPVLSGQHIVCGKTGGWFVLKALSDRPIGDTLPAATNANWEIVVDNVQGWRAARRMLGQMTSDVVDVFDAHFGKDKVIPVAGGQTGGFSDVTIILEQDDLYLKMADRAHGGRIALAPYWGAELGVWNAQHIPGWGATEKALLASTDPVEKAAGKAAFWAAADTVIDQKIDQTETTRNQLLAWLADRDLPSVAILLSSYECNQHWVFYGATGNTWPATILDTFNELIESPELGLATTRYANGLRDRIGGEHVWFDRVLGIPSTPKEMTDQGKGLSYWALSASEEDTGLMNYRLQSILESAE